MIRINLLPYREIKKKAALKRQIFITAVLVGFVIVFLTCLHGYMTLSIRNLEREVKVSQNRLEILKKVTGNLEQFKRDKEIAEKKLKVIENLEYNRMEPVNILNEFSARKPDGQVWLTLIEKTGGNVEVQGMASNNAAIALFMKNMEQSPYIQAVDLISSKQAVVSDVKLMNFALVCTIKKE